MGFVSFPVAPASVGDELDRAIANTVADRRWLRRGGAELGLAAAAAGFAGYVSAPEVPPMPPGDTVGSDPSAPSTGDSPFTRDDPWLPPVEAGEKTIEIVARDATVYVPTTSPWSPGPSTAPSRVAPCACGRAIR